MTKKIAGMVFLLCALMVCALSVSSSAAPHCRWVYFRNFPTGYEIKIATSTTVLADIANQIGKDRVDAVPLVKSREDAHSPVVTGRMREIMREADVVAVVGMGYDSWVH
jgi:ABC-type Zn uptake system ZnuABC Zn-binding protein ZnuA